MDVVLLKLFKCVKRLSKLVNVNFVGARVFTVEKDKYRCGNMRKGPMGWIEIGGISVNSRFSKIKYTCVHMCIHMFQFHPLKGPEAKRYPSSSEHTEQLDLRF